ncbi:MAG: insulinase family protein [Muribaculaceae bacterium]|nr:insulinase family protein [Muribaculaceae bacterium]
MRTGTLPNGLTYFVKHNNYPEHRADFFIAQRVGSLQEKESQRGLAHFLEHMCFNGTKHFPGNSLISYMESIGVKFGANLNAYTSTDETVYNISNVPTERRSALDSCFLVLADWGHDLTLDGKEIDKERGVIEGEWRMRTGANYRLLEKSGPQLYPGNLYGERMPIGLMSVVKNFKHKELRNYYKQWYHPANQCIIVVGDIDPDYAVSKIVELFANVKSPKNFTPVEQVVVPDNEQIISCI